MEEVLKIVLQDQAFYEESGGGLTLSGGELLLQPEFSRELLLAAKEEGIHTCCETTGFATEDTFDHVMEYGENKYHLLNIKYDYENVPSYHPEDLKEYLNIFKENNINAFF